MSVLRREVSLFVADEADELVGILCCLQVRDDDTNRARRALRHKVAVLGLLDEGPIVPAALTAILERRTTPVSPTAFQFISTRAQLGDVRMIFIRALPRLLAA